MDRPDPAQIPSFKDWEVVVFPSEIPSRTGKKCACHGMVVESLWPEAWSIESLHARRQEIGEIAYSAQYMNDIELMKGRRMKHSDIRYYESLEPRRLKQLQVYGGVDLAAKTHQQAHHNVMMTMGFDAIGNGFVLDYFRERCTIHTIYHQILQDFQRFKHLSIGVETIAYQQVMADLLKDNTLIPVREIKCVPDKVLRHQKIATRTQNNKIYLMAWMTDLLREMLEDPEPSTDDLLDAMEICISLHFENSSEPRVRWLKQ